jgi:hypothetical protein
MSRHGGTVRIGIGKRVAEALSAGIGMPLDNGYLTQHGIVPIFVFSQPRSGFFSADLSNAR